VKRSEQDRLLRDVLADENLARLRRDSLASGLRSIRNRKRRRTILSLAATFALVLAVFLVVRRGPETAASPSVAETTRPHIKLISDEQLFALFPGRSAALIGSPGAQKLIFLDTLAASPASGEK